jgi:hypothetical protein
MKIGLEEEIRDLIPQAKGVSKGSMDPIWDSIWDAEAWLKGQRTLIGGDRPRDAVGRDIRDDLKQWVTIRLGGGDK